MTKPLVINFLLFQLGWFACVLGGAHDQVLAGSLIAFAVIAYHLFRATDTSKELRLLAIALLIGLIFESMVTYMGLAIYNYGQVFDLLAPFWMILMWPLFATTLNISMRWLKPMSPWLVAVIGAVFAPFAYYAGNRLGAVSYDDISLSLSVIAIAWALLFPLLVIASLKFDGFNSALLERDKHEDPQHV